MGATNSFLMDQKSSFSIGNDMPLWALEVIQYCPWETRAAISQLSRNWRSNTQTLQYYRFLCLRLAAENGIYVPKVPPPRENWKTLFFELYKLRYLWDPSAQQLSPQMNAALQERSKISVYAKFRPHIAKPETSSTSSSANQESELDKNTKPTGVTLPLHQRLAMIRLSHKVKNNRTALKVLAEEGAWFEAKWSTIANTEANITKEQVFTTDDSPNKKSQSSHMIQKHQLLTKQKKAGSKEQHKIISKVHSLDAMNGRVVMITPDVGLREFSFDGVLPTNTSQKHAYDLCTKRLVMDMLNGFNATAIVYGQTGTILSPLLPT